MLFITRRGVGVHTGTGACLRGEGGTIVNGTAAVQTESNATFGESHFGQAQLGDRRRTRRLVRVADSLVRHPGGTLPHKLNSPSELGATYHLMNCETVTHQSVFAPHRQRTLEQIQERPTFTLVIHDTTELDFTTHASLKDDLGPIGSGNHTGYLCHNSLAIDPETRTVIGLTNQILHQRAVVPPGETSSQRRQRTNRESRLWLQGTQTLPASKLIVDLCDRGGDTFEFLESECQSGRRFVVRSSHQRSMFTAHDTTAPSSLLHDFARTLTPLATHTTKVAGKWITPRVRKGQKKRIFRPARQAQLQVSAAPVLIKAPQSKKGEHGDQPLPLWIVRVWEVNPPAGAEENCLEWFLLTNHPVTTAQEALQVVNWYECRWVIEEYHKAAKTGCGIENPQFTAVSRLEPMIALLSVVALSLLNLRAASRDPEARTRPATDLFSLDYIHVLSVWRHGRVCSEWTIHEFFYALARLGGHQNRKRDHPPGWLVLWRGWTQLQAMLDGAHAQEIINKCA